SLRTIYNNNTKRLLLAVTSRPAQYNLYDKSTKLTSTALNFKFDVSADSYTAKLYIDHNNNGAFEEAAVKTDTSSSGTLSYSLSEYKGGLIYWKLEVSSGKMTASSTGATYIKPNGEKQDVRVLEILPCEKVDYTCNYGPQQGVTLMFCIECQRANMPIEWNPIVTNPWSDTYRTYSSMYTGADLTSNFGNGGPYGRPITDEGIISNSGMDAVYIGKHEHKFGIVKYGGSEVYSDPAKGEYDDWDWNFADELSDMYNFHIDMMTTREYEALDAKIKSDYTPLIGDLTELTAAELAVTNAKKALDDYVKGSDYTTAIANVETAIAHIRDQGINYNNSVVYFKEEMQRLLDEKCYYDFFSSFGNVHIVNAALEMNEKEMWNSYETWARANDKKIELTDAYMQALYKYNFLNTEGKDWLTGSYSSVVIGACENFGNDDLAKDACGALNEYATKGGQIITFHECFGRLKDNPTAGNITAAIMDAAGVNAYSDTQRMSSDAGQSNPAAGSMRSYYKYGSINWTHVAKWANAADQTNGIFNPGTDQAVINNRCAVNIFPFTLSDKLKITGTHPVGYAIDTDDLNVTPLYTLTTSNYQNEYQTVYPASPVDGSDNAFIYSSGNFYYCGAGHSKVTGLNKNNNDERRLYINIICNSVANSSIMPEEPGIDVFDYSDGTGEEKNDIVVPDGDNGYIYELEEKDEIPEFSFKATVDAKTQIDYVNIYYKLDKSFLYKTDPKELKLALAFNNEKDKMIAGNLDAKAGTLYDIDATQYPGLKLTKEMFDAYGGNYTYIIIEVVDTEGNESYQKIKVTKKVHLFDLT
ncbi:MAG: hypothetical protein PUA62_06080, partial [Lachnospiraceae bacterium]|nr:hypothetical protein [Lachnospiraceae bacterium]